MNSDIENIQSVINENYSDLKAEVIASQILNNTTITPDNIILNNLGIFSRSYRDDIASVKIDEAKDFDKSIRLNVYRKGIYDLLPEGVFHKIEKKKSSETYISVRKRLKQEESNARLLFSPIENELFHQRIKTERSNRSIIKNFSNLSDNFLLNFWKIDKTIPRKYSVKMVRLLPYAHKISGDLKVVFLSLEKILDVHIQYTKRYLQREVKYETKHSQTLGVSFVLYQESNKIMQPVLDVMISTKNEEDVSLFLKKRGVYKFLHTFYDFFLPYEYEIRTNFEVENNNEFVLDAAGGSHLGVTSTI